ncbi:hypothetical protein RhiirA4_471763 [Rhizophagus irregularis]|uniref:Uncharacterized protein n=1 Tax=Rhizophagus irregularis TaxID=588596 RepID=A0A2I1H3Q8_9GLOM|nr:hypothetical protein RhiirA4_471763 [Rhizophagus irregularis]
MRCNNVIIVCHHPNEPKWLLEEKIFNYISYKLNNYISNKPFTPYYEDVKGVHGRHNNISPIYVTQKYQCVPKVFVKMQHIYVYSMVVVQPKIFLELYVCGGSMKIIKKYLREREFIVFDLTRPETDELAVRV